MDLIASGAVDGQVSVNRLNGQKVFSVNNKMGTAVVKGIVWKPNGWGINLVDADTLQIPRDKLGREASLDDLFSPGAKRSASDSPPDLPRDLAFLDVEALLPRLSSLSSGGVEDEVFDSRMSLDTLFQPESKVANDSADLLVIGFEDDGETLCMTPLDLRLISSTGRYLSLLASKSTRLHNLLRYMQQVQKQIYSEFKASQDLPRRFVRNVEETLQETHDCTWTQAAYHTVVTGHCFPQVKEWLVEELGERGHKRWEKAATTGYETIRRLTHENLLPALERFTILVSRLRGLSKFQNSKASFGLSTQELDNVLDTVSCLQLLTHHVLITASSELSQFSAFSAWLRQEIETQSTDTSASTAQEMNERDPHIDHASTLEYIQGAMKQSRLVDLFNLAETADGQPQWDIAAEGRSLYDLYKRELRRPSKPNFPEKQLPGLDALLAHLDMQCSAVFHGIAETQTRNIRFGSNICLGKGNTECIDMRMVLEKDVSEMGRSNLYTVIGPSQEAKYVSLFKLEIVIENGISTTVSVQRALVHILSGFVQDAKFEDDEKLMLAVKGESSSKLLSINYRRMEHGAQGLIYEDFDNARHKHGDSSSVLTLNPFDAGDISQYSQHTFPAGATWAPERLQIGGRKGRRAVCVLAQDKLRYRVYDLHSSITDSGEEALPTDLGSEDAIMT
ncbi:MAG: hypothetical protein Q9191_000627 [Dirinaria sp. TL-2023a]